MELELQITARNIPLPDDMEATIRHEADKLESFYPRIIGCRVFVEAEHRFAAGEIITYAVRIDLTVPRGEIPTTRQSGEDLLTAVQSAFAACRRQLEDYARVQRGDVGTPQAEPLRARVLRLFPWEGYGFLETGDGRELYFHRNSVVNNGFDRLEVGAEVRFAEGVGLEGPQATSVVPVKRRRVRQARGDLRRRAS